MFTFLLIVQSLVAASLVGVILISISGYLGGELVFRYGLGVNERSEGEPTIK